MNIPELKERHDVSEHIKLNGIYTQFRILLNELRTKELPPSLTVMIHKDLEELNTTPLTGETLRKLLKKKQTNLLKTLEKDVKIVPKNHYRNLWLALGMTVFGIPIGLIFGSSIDNMGLMTLGLPIGMTIGIAVGSQMDKKAFEEGRQLNIELKY